MIIKNDIDKVLYLGTLKVLKKCTQKYNNIVHKVLVVPQYNNALITVQIMNTSNFPDIDISRKTQTFLLIKISFILLEKTGSRIAFQEIAG